MLDQSGRLLPGASDVIGAHADEGGVNFALYSAHAERVELCLFDATGAQEIARLPMPEHTDQVWHGYLPGAGPGLCYNYRVYGRDAPEEGHRFDGGNLLLDPYARAWKGRLGWSKDPAGAELIVPQCIVTAEAEPLGLARRIMRPMAETVIYEAHVKGLSALHPAIAREQRGTYAALRSPVLIDHLVRLGITAIELMPCQAFLDERRLVRQGLSNYWGYNPIGFFVVEPRYAATAEPLAELQAAIAALHQAGIEVILDVVYNHTGEGDEDGPSLSFRGIDNASYYRLEETGAYVNLTGCGNSLNLEQPRVLQMVMDSLRYWVEIVGVDGFRFDLAVTLGREGQGFDPGAGFFDAIRQDPVLGRVKLIAEPWDIGDQGYRLGGFPPGWAEWNDRYRDAVRSFWRGDEQVLPELAARLLGSADIFERQGRRSFSSINLVTSHDGFTLADLVTFEGKHNGANGEEGRDGHHNNLSWNNGIEGPSDDPLVLAARLRDRKNLLATLLLSQGTPMLLMGDELGRTQAGNNNAYCQDNATSWVDWEAIDEELLVFAREIIAFRAAHPVLRRARFMHGEKGNVRWWHPKGREMQAEDWEEAREAVRKAVRKAVWDGAGQGAGEDAWQGDCVGLLLDGAASEERDSQGRSLTDDLLLIWLNAGPEMDVCLPIGRFETLVATHDQERRILDGTCRLAARSLCVMRACRSSDPLPAA